MHAQLLKMLEGCSSQKPMPFDQLAIKSGLLDSTLDMVLDQMYAAHTINQAKVMRNGITQREVWPTGVISPTTYAIANAARVVPTPPCAVLKPQPETTNSTEQKPKALAILEFIEATPDCHVGDISNATKIDFPRSYIKTAIRDGMVVLDTSEQLKTTFRLAPGMTAKSIYGSGRRKPAPKVIATRPQDKAMLATEAGKELVEKAAAALEEEYDIPAFLRKKAEPQEGEFGEFKVAYTSSGTLMLFGLQYLPVELNVEQTDLLIEYLDGQVK